MFNQHQMQDAILYIPFLLGQLLYILKRAGFSMRAGRAKTRRAYVWQNWDILLFRTVLEFAVIYFPIRHFSPGQLLSLFHINLNSSMPLLSEPVTSPVSILLAGIAADGLFDWLVDFLSRSPKVPPVVKIWLSENVQPPEEKP